MHTVVWTYRFRQLWKIVREIPPPYLVILAIMLAVAVAGLSALASSVKGGWIIIGACLLLLILLHIRRKDYRFIHHIDDNPRRVFAGEYLLLFFSIVLIECMRYQWLPSLLLIAGCVVVALLPQPGQSVKKGMPVPHLIPASLFEIRSGFRQYGAGMGLLYAAILAGLFIPYLSLGLLFLYTLSFMEFFRLSEPLSILCARELPSTAFLHRKLCESGLAYLIIQLPVCVLYAVIYPDHAWLAASFLFYGTLNICLMVVTKYAYYRPHEKIVGGQFSLFISVVGMVLLILLPFTLVLFVKNYLAAHHNISNWLYAYDKRSTLPV